MARPGRPRSPIEKAYAQFYITVTTRRRLRLFAESMGVSQAFIVEGAIVAALDRLLAENRPGAARGQQLWEQTLMPDLPPTIPYLESRVRKVPAGTHNPTGADINPQVSDPTED